MHETTPSSKFEHLPPIFGVEQLSLLLNKAPATIFADRCRAPERVPPAFMPPGTKQPLWILTDVIEWLRNHPEQPRMPSDDPRPVCLGRGRPTKTEEVAARKAGLSVREFRKRQRKGVAS